MLDGRVLEASQVEYKPFGKPALKREPASSRASSQSGFRVQAQSNNTPRPFSWGLNPVALPQSQSSRASCSGQSRLPPPSFDQLARDIEAA